MLLQVSQTEPSDNSKAPGEGCQLSYVSLFHWKLVARSRNAFQPVCNPLLPAVEPTAYDE